MSLTAEQRRALALLMEAGLDGASQASLMAHGFCVSMIAGLVKRGLATLTCEKVRAGGRLVDVGKVRITAAGRDALTAERWRSTLWARPHRVPERDLHRKTKSAAEEAMRTGAESPMGGNCKVFLDTCKTPPYI